MPIETPKKRCKYKNAITGWQCPREALPDSKDGFCICHERRDDKDEKLFREEIDRILKDENANAYHFEGFYFPFGMDFSRFQFKENTYFVGAIFKKIVTFLGTQFSGKETDFSNAEFWGEMTSFSGAKFPGEKTSFNGAKFPGEMTYFNGAKFSGEETSFSWAEFSGKDTGFSGAKFSGKETSFNGAKFSGKETDFFGAQFSGERTSFFRTQFSGERASFFRTQFSGGKTDFSQAQFSGNLTDFSHAIISNFLNFSNSSFQSKETKFYYLELGENAKLIFLNTLFEQSNKNDLTKIDLSKCLFQETNLEYCDLSLSPMNWKTKLLNESIAGSPVASATGIKGIVQKLSNPILGLFKTSKIDKIGRFSQAAESYRMLKVNFNKRQDYGRAAICHYREEVCKRKALKWWTPVGSLAYLYSLVLQLSCGYGEKLQNVLGFTVFLFILFPLVLSFTPLVPTGSDLTTVQHIDGWQQLSYWSRLTGALKYTFFHLLPLWRLSDLRAATDLGNIISGVMTIAGAFMIGLFIYVFRRRLMR